MKNILGLDVGTNSIGWCLLQKDSETEKGVLTASSRIIPMGNDILGKFDAGVTVSANATRTLTRQMRRMYQRAILRRERTLRILHLMNFLPEHFDTAYGWEPTDHHTFAKPLDEKAEVKIAWTKNEVGQPKFLFHNAYKEMAREFQPGSILPHDWTLYYLRKKALTQAVSKEELSWIILSFNQKRGYKESRGEEEEEVEKNETKEYIQATITKVEADGEGSKGKRWYSLTLDNGDVYRRQSTVPLYNWEGLRKEFIKTTTIDKNGKEKTSFSAPEESDWDLVMKRTENAVEKSNCTIGAYIYHLLQTNTLTKIRGKEVAHIHRSFYREELRLILEKQQEFIPELNDRNLYKRCVEELYPKNTNHRDSLLQKSFIDFFVDDLIFYQRPLKSKKSQIANCPYETRSFSQKGKSVRQGVKCTPRSNPYFQEFRLWNFINNLRIYVKEHFDSEDNLQREKDVTQEFLGTKEARALLFEQLNNLSEIKENDVLKYFQIASTKKKEIHYRWNYVDGRSYPGNETRAAFIKILDKLKINTQFLNQEGEKWNEKLEYRLWHLLYSIEEKDTLKKALGSLVIKEGLSKEKQEAFISEFIKIKPYESQYAAYSEKAIRRLLPLIRQGKYWDAEAIPSGIRARIQKLLDGETDKSIPIRVYEKTAKFHQEKDFSGLPEWLACYIVYGRHSETTNLQNWESPADLAKFIKRFKQHSMRNPIVENVVLETLRVVHDIWEKYGSIDEIHVELGRSMKKSKKEREKLTAQLSENQKTNLRIKRLLEELATQNEAASVRPYSPTQQELLKIYEEGVIASNKDIPKDIIAIRQKKEIPSTKEITRYRLWLDQKYCSPYTGQPISLSRLFTRDYEIEHIIPKRRYFDDSLNNKVICETAVNQKKGCHLAHEFIVKYGGQDVPLGNGQQVRLLTVKEYENSVLQTYPNNQGKRERLLTDDIPEKFLNRQSADTGYIAKVIMKLLSNVVRLEGEEEATSKNLIPCQGGVTARLRRDWGLEDVWNSIIYPRFERMNKIHKTTIYGQWENKNGKQVFQTNMPLEYSKGFTKKRIDHRHHALDAIVIACATRGIIQFLNNESAKDASLRDQEASSYFRAKQLLKKPWDTFTQDARAALEDIVVSFKPNLRTITKATNTYQVLDDNGKRLFVKQKSKDQWAIRKSLHKATTYGKVNLRSIVSVSLSKALDKPQAIVDTKLKRYILHLQNKMNYTKKQWLAHFKGMQNSFLGKEINKVDIYVFSDDIKPLVANRRLLDTNITIKQVEAITDSGIRTILKRYLAYHGGEENHKIAFTPENLDYLNKHIADFNNGKPHCPIYKVRIAETEGEKYPLGLRGNRSKKYVEADKGTNLYCAFYVSADGKRSYKSIPYKTIIEREKQRTPIAPQEDEKGNKLLFTLSPNELVYLPTAEENTDLLSPETLDKKRIYKMLKSTGTSIFFIKHEVAISLVDGKEFSSSNGMERAITEEMIKATCLKLKVNRLGQIIQIIGKPND